MIQRRRLLSRANAHTAHGRIRRFRVLTGAECIRMGVDLSLQYAVTVITRVALPALVNPVQVADLNIMAEFPAFQPAVQNPNDTLILLPPAYCFLWALRLMVSLLF